MDEKNNTESENESILDADGTICPYMFEPQQGSPSEQGEEGEEGDLVGKDKPQTEKR